MTKKADSKINKTKQTKISEPKEKIKWYSFMGSKKSSKRPDEAPKKTSQYFPPKW